MGKSNNAHVSSISDGKDYKSWSLSKEQKTLGNVMKSNDLIFVSGKAGVGKTSGILYHYISDYVDDKHKEIIVIRTPVEAGFDKIGALPNGVEEKTEPHFKPARNIINQLLGSGKADCDIRQKRIRFEIPNFVLGDTFDNALIIISEAQQMPPEIVKLLVERIGKNSKCVVEGDPSQLYAEGRRNGLSHAMDVFFDSEGNSMFSNRIGMFKFSNKINMRSDIVQDINNAYEAYGKL